MRYHRTLALAALLPLLAACSLSGQDEKKADAPAPGSAAPKSTQVTLVTHDSWNPPKGAIEEFEKQSGYKVTVLKSGDAGAMTNKLVLTKGSPLGDAVYGIDNTFASRAVKNGVLEEYQVPDVPGAADHAASGAGAKVLTPVDFGDVCVNVDDSWFAKKGTKPPKTLDDLKDPRFKGLLAVPGASTSSPGLAFLLATIGRYGQDGWKPYWKSLIGNDAKVVKGWEEAYNTEFTGGSGGKGTRPVVVSYASSPPFTIAKGATAPSTSALLDTCFRQTEYAGVLKGARNPEGGKALVSFLLGRTFQDGMAENMYMYPVRKDAKLPADWEKFAPLAPKPWQVGSDEIDAKRETWVREWQEIAAR